MNLDENKMNGDEYSKLTKFTSIINEIITNMGMVDVVPNEKEIKKFLTYIDDNNLLYNDKDYAIQAGFSDKLVPLEYIMNLTCPVTQEIFIKGGPELLPGIIKGVIHVGSILEFIKPIVVNHSYKIKIKVDNPVKKTGSKGNYYSVVFKLYILNENEKICAIDNHEFFFKLD